ncbi:integrase DNA-binding domain-containing protein [Ructibacterium gallinarum]|uniref:Site-specific integrase n=1 Tax=Ructibacterium gallinarum TaxID=2779355 RepID=A0A9D5M284_9FIRM|nr:tyrosine-type recombinase/integrase [Ructibacterium gallinarum]MBE5041242.1 site-specific integrase [Ructibacterium gallinarum]
MSEKRRDNKGRILLSNERQRPDGKYEYRYIDRNGVKHSIYSWKLVSTDKIPNGKKCEESLRDMKRKIEKDLEDGIDPAKSQNTTLNQYYEEYINSKYELKTSTRVNYKYLYEKYIKDNLGNKKMYDIKYIDIKNFYIYLVDKLGLKIGTIKIIDNILHQMFNVAVRNGDIRYNPTTGVIYEIKKANNFENIKRRALTIPQQELLIDFCKNNTMYNHWLPLITVFLGTGCRVGEIIGLRWEDCDFEKSIISINHILTYRPQDNRKYEFHITTPKTKNSIRIIPMLKDVKKVLLEERLRQMKIGFNTSVIDGYSGFIFQSRVRTVIFPQKINEVLESIRIKCNQQEEENAIREMREPVIIPHFSVHNLRHTFCTRFCENETNIKVIQEIMGHADITTTMDVYNEATIEKKVESFFNLEGKIKIN